MSCLKTVDPPLVYVIARIEGKQTVYYLPGNTTFQELYRKATDVTGTGAVGDASATARSNEVSARLHALGKFDPDSGVILSSLTLPLSLCADLNLRFIDFTRSQSPDLEPQASTSAARSASATTPTAYDVLMKSGNKRVLPDKIETTKTQSLNSQQQMYNDVVDWMSVHDCSWTKNTLHSGTLTVRYLVNALWYIEHAHEQLSKQGCHIPHCFAKFQNYRDYSKLHRARPAFSWEKLNEICLNLTKALSYPSTRENVMLSKGIEQLLAALSKYSEHLQKDRDLHQKKRAKVSPPIMPHYETSLTFIDAIPKVDQSIYGALDTHLSNIKPYAFVDLDEFSPPDRLKRRKYVSQLRVSESIMLYRVVYGGSLGTVNFVWKIVKTDPEAQKIVENAAVIEELTKSLPKYSSRAARRDFIESYAKVVKCPKSVLRHMYSELTGTVCTAETAMQQEVDDRVKEYMLTSDEPDLLLDLREEKTSTGDTKFDVFFDEVEKYLGDQLAVQERRHGEEQYIPFAMSTEDLRAQVMQRVPQGTPVPSTETLRLQFHPGNPYRKKAERYSGRFNLKFRVQTRMSRMHHIDMRYVATQFKYLKEFAVVFKNQSTMVFMDDKAVVPIGEPGLPISTGVRGHNKVLAQVDKPLTALDHDFHTAGIIPSVAMVAKIPNNKSDSFFDGQVVVTLKDKVFQPSSPFRHAAELSRLLRDGYSDDDVSLSKPVLLLFTDGGPDHRITFDTVKVSLLEIFMQLDLDMLIAMRTAPNNSWVNPAERCMSILNLGLQHVALSRTKMTDELEAGVKNKSSLTALRKYAEWKEGVAQAYAASMEGVIQLLADRFARLSLKGVPFKTYTGLTTEEVAEQLDIVKQVTDSDTLTTESSSKAVRGHKELMEFMKTHSRSANYCYQLKKCSRDECGYCTINPVRMDQETFSRLAFLPEPEPEGGDDHYKEFSQLYGKELPERPDRYMPSAKIHGIDPEAQDSDKSCRDVLKSGKVRASIDCSQCLKPRCVYSMQKLTKIQEDYLESVRDDVWYTCGDGLSDVNLVVRRAIDCTSPVETTYYSCSIYLPSVCIHCGDPEDLLDDYHDYMVEMHQLYSTVRPLCTSCYSTGKQAVTWGKKFFHKKQKLDKK